MVYRLLVPWPGIKPMPPALEAWSLNHWTLKKVPHFLLNEYCEPPPHPLNRMCTTLLYGCVSYLVST